MKMFWEQNPSTPTKSVNNATLLNPFQEEGEKAATSVTIQT